MHNRNFFPDGIEFYNGYPIIAGGSAGEVPQFDTGEEGGEPETDSGPGEEVTQESGEQLNSEQESIAGELGADFLKGIEDQHLKEALQPYVKEWDAGVTKKFQELRGQLSPYQELGDPEQLQQAVEIFRILEEDPLTVYRALAEALGQEESVQQSQGGQQQQQQQQPQTAQELAEEQGISAEEYAALPPEFQKKFEQMENLLTIMAESYLNEERQKKLQEEDQQLEQFLTSLKEEHGDFDEEYVLAKMLNGIDAEEAVKQYQNLLGQQQQQQQQNEPQQQKLTPLSSSGGAVPFEGQDVRKLSQNDTKSLVADLMAKATQQVQE